SESAVLPLDDPPTARGDLRGAPWDRPFRPAAACVQGRRRTGGKKLHPAKDFQCPSGQWPAGRAAPSAFGNRSRRCSPLTGGSGVKRAQAGQGERGRPAAPPQQDLLAVLDLGTNNCRLLIATPAARGGFKVIDSFSRIVRLGEGVGQTGMLSPAAMDRTIAALKVCAERIGRLKADRVRCIATQAARLAGNTNVLVTRARTEAGLNLEVISAEEEASLAALGCVPLIGRRSRGALVFDIGGGSTEIIWLARTADG